MSRPVLALVSRWLPLLAALALVVPASTVRPATISLTAVERASAVDFGDGVLWVLALGSDARPGQEVTKGNTDAIQLIGINRRTGHAVAIGVPRDSWVDLPGVGLSRINAAVAEGGADLAARAVEDLVGITPELVLVTGFEGFESMLGSIGEVEVDSPLSFHLDEVDLPVRRGPNSFDSREALAFARSRRLAGDDLGRSANHQQLLLGVLRELRARKGDAGFLEGVASAAIAGLRTDLSPGELYRFVQAVTLVDPRRVQACVVGGTFAVEFGASVIHPDLEQARALGTDARDDARLQGGCRER